jgi:hypothetical protein
LEARELLTAYPLSFYLDPGASHLSLSGYDSNTERDITPQGNGALVTQYSGRLNSLYDPTAHTLQFLLGGSTLEAANNGSWNPTLSGDDGSQPANYGGYAENDFIVPLEWSHLALRDIGGGLSNATPVSVAGGSIAPAETLNITQGGLAYRYAGVEYIASGSVIVRAMAGNSNAAAGSFQDLGDGSFHISLPINVSFNVPTTGGNYVDLTLSGTLNATASFCTAQVVGGVLTATNAGPAATLTLSHAGSTTTICGASFADNSYSSVVINTGHGHDIVNIEYALTGKPVTVNDGSGSDDVYISPSAQNLNNIQAPVTVHGNHAGTDNLIIDDQNNGGSQTFTLGIDSVARGAASIFYDNLADHVTVNGGNGGNTFNVQALSGSYLSVSLNTGPFNNVINVGSPAGSLDTIQAPLTVNGQGGLNTLNINDQGNPFDRTYTVTSNTVGRQGASTITYSSIQTLTVNSGSSSNDVVNVQSTSASTRVVCHASYTVNVGLAGQTHWINGDLRISDPPVGAFATVNVDDSADSSYRTVTHDTVAITGLNYGRIRGLSQGDILYRYIDANSATVKTGPGGAHVQIQYTEKPVNLIGNPAAPVSLFGSDGANNAWTITSQNAGALSSPRIAGPVTFSGVSNLHGGDGGNSFVFADQAGLTGAIDGGGGTNTLDYTAYSTSVLVDLQTGSATGVFGGVSNIQNVTGGSTGGGPGIYNILVGNGGNVLTGGTGRRNLLIAGGTASTLSGGNDDDILIGGTTAYDTEPGLVSLQAIMDYWSNTADDYGTRVANLLSASGVPLLDSTMVFNNGGGNTLTGNQGGPSELNLFYGLDPALETTDSNPAIGEQFINC